MNFLKINDTSFSLHSEQENSSDSYNATSIVQESDIDKFVKNKRAKYLDSPKKENLSDAEDLSSDNIHEIEDIMTNKKSLCNAVNNNFESEVDDTEKSCSTSFNFNPSIKDKYNLQDNDKSSKDHNIVANIFETYSELDDSLDI